MNTLLANEKTLSSLLQILPRILTSYLPAFLSLALAHLTSLLPVFQQYHVAEDGGDPPPATTPDDPDQDIFLPNFASDILGFINLAASGGRVKGWFMDNQGANIGACVRVVAGWSQMTDEDVSRSSIFFELERCTRLTEREREREI